MKILDRYLLKELLFPILFCSAMLIMLVMISDIFNHLDEILKNKTSFSIVLQYYLTLIPQMFVETISWASFLGTIYVLSSFNYHNEIIAMKVSGLEITSIIRPVLFVGFFLGIVTFLISDRVVPYTSRKKQQILEEQIEKKKASETHNMFQNVTHYGNKDRLYYLRTFWPKTQTMDHFTILWLDAKGKIKKKTIVREAVWTGAEWELHNVTDYLMERNGEIFGEPVFKAVTVYPEITETPDDFLNAARGNQYISYRELKDYIDKLKENEIKLYTESVTLHNKLSSPWNALAVMFLTIPLLAKSATRRRIAPTLLFCLALVFLFHTFGAMMLALGKAGKIMPLLSAWSHQFLFGFGTFFFIERANH